MQVLREALVGLLSLEDDLDVVGDTDRGDQALALIAAVTPDIVILDLDLPGIDGLSVARAIKDSTLNCKVLVLSAHDRPGAVREALDTGVLGFLPKGVSIDTLIDAIHHVHKGTLAISPELLRSAINGASNPLTPRERTLLRIMATGDTAKEVARHLHLAEGTVRNHVTRILQKLNARNKLEAVRIANDSGWL